MHLVNEETLLKQHNKQIRGKAVGIDKITKEIYDENKYENIDNLLNRMKKFSYRLQPSGRTYIPKANGDLRSLGIPSYEDKLVQGAMTDILNEIYENIFLDISYGFRENMNGHKAISQINFLLMTKKIN